MRPVPDEPDERARTAGVLTPAGRAPVDEAVGVVRDTAHGWYTLAAEQVLAVLDTTIERGLSSEEVELRLAQHGPNVLADARRRHPIRILLSQLSDVMVLVLLGAALVAIVLGEAQDVAAILAIVVLNAFLGFVQEYRAERALAALKALGAPLARVRRDSVVSMRPTSGLVPGDIVLLEAGNIVPADLRLVEAARVRIDESTLTGESQPVEKSTAPLDRRDLPIGDHRNMAYKGTVVSYGRGTGVVIATGLRTELGRIASLLREEEEVQTPLQRRLARFGRVMAVAVVALCTVIFVVGLLRGEQPTLMFMTALSLAVAAIPEALPAVVSLSLAFGARKMARQQALIRRLPAVETLGSVTYICADKTGTLTENRMSVEALQLPENDDPLPVSGVAGGARLDPLLTAMALSNDATRSMGGTPSGDPTEVALYACAAGRGFTREALAQEWPRVAELPFSSERARMTTIHRNAQGTAFLALTKGAPERVLPLCSGALDDAMSRFDPETILAGAERMAASGLRVLAFSRRELVGLPARLDDAEGGHVFLGLVGLLDPPRAEVGAAVGACQSAGVRVVMITGDHPSTARAIAERLHIASDSDRVVTGEELVRMSAEALAREVDHVRVYARVAPEDKIRVVKALQARGEHVAVTGDGVNDAPALRRADIGVAMGRSGTDVAREAAHMVLLDDNFATIVMAVREGRRIYDNIRRFVRYSLSTNAGEIWTLFVAPFLGQPLPLLPIHILWMNLITDGLPGLALAAEPPARDVMQRSPRAPQESIFANGLWQHAVWVGLLMAALALAMQAWALQAGNPRWQSMTFTVLTLSQLAHVLAIRSERDSLFTQGLWTNRPLVGAVVLTVVMQLATLYVEPLNRVFRTTPLTAWELAACGATASVVFVAVEVEKAMIRRGWLGRPAAIPPGRATAG